MVMETPSPQCVGREFVRQYYTLLNEAPTHLHRFYSSASSFVHGGVEPPGEEQPPIIGQADIHKKILSLNFRDCHAKIRQVDSQATVGDAVVVQVSGELSNNGQQMRRFMQTFILAPQSHKKYYVHNDIFRYQDEVYRDTDSEPENIEANEMVSDSEGDSIDQATSPETVQEVPAPPSQSIYEPAAILSNGSMHMHEPAEATNLHGATTPFSEPEPIDEPPAPTYDEPVVNAPVEEEKVHEEQVFVEEPDKPVTWAAMARKSGGSNAVTVHTNHSTVQKQVPPPLANSPHDTTTALPQRQISKVQRERPTRDRERNSIGRGDGDGDSDSQSSRRSVRHPDNHQVFVGNLPNNCFNKDLKIAFEEFGNIVDIRINNKPTGPFAFVTFDGPEPVRNLLDFVTKEAIMVNNTHLNVEEKKAREPMRAGGGGMRGPRQSGGLNPTRGGSNRGGPRGRGDLRGGPPRSGFGPPPPRR